MTDRTLPLLPDTYGATREALRTLVCYVLSPARKARTGRIGLRSLGDAFGTPPFDDGSRILVRGDQLVDEPDRSAPITTLRAAADFLGVELSPDPGVGHDLPPFEPDAVLPVDAAASRVVAEWYDLGRAVLAQVADERADAGPFAELQIWPEHFDLATDHKPEGSRAVNLGASPGDEHHAEPYLYVGPFKTDDLEGAFWNAPFGAVLGYGALIGPDDPFTVALRFFRQGLDLAAQLPAG